MKVLNVASGRRDEIAAATAVKNARVNYEYRLNVLKSHYERTGNMDKLLWARAEMRNLARAQTFAWGGLPEIIPPVGESLVGVREPLLVEHVVSARKAYLSAVSELAKLYERRNDDFKARLIRNMQLRFDPVRIYAYILEVDVPPADLRPMEVIPEADRMYAEAIELHGKGKGLLRIFVTTDYRKQRKALMILRSLVRNYPRSTKAALAAYYIGEISKEYFNEDLQAVLWYQRAWQWDPNINKPARFQAATVHDLRLKNKAKAIRCYEMAIRHEQFNQSNVSFAHRRIRELMKE